MNTRKTTPEQLPLPIYKIAEDDGDYVEFARWLNEVAKQGYRLAAVLPADKHQARAVIMEHMDASGCFDLTDQGRAAITNDVIDDCTADHADYVSFLREQEREELESQMAAAGDSDAMLAQDAREALANCDRKELAAALKLAQTVDDIPF
jgi:hypothetical protein